MVLGLSVSVLGWSPSASAEPLSFLYQGYLTDLEGEEVSGTIDVLLRLYENAEDIVPFWEEAHTDVVVQRGLLTLEVGTVVPLPMPLVSVGAKWLGIQVGEDSEAEPRLMLGAIPLSLESKRADVAQRCESTDGLSEELLAELDERWGDADTPHQLAGLDLSDGPITLSGGAGIAITQQDRDLSIQVTSVPWTEITSAPPIIRSVSGAEPLAGALSLVGGANVTVTPQTPTSNGITVGVPSVPWSDITSKPSVVSSVANVSPDGGNIDLLSGTGITIVPDNDANAITLGVAGVPWASLSGAPSVISSLNGVTNHGGNVDLVASTNFALTPDDGSNTISLAANLTSLEASASDSVSTSSSTDVQIPDMTLTPSAGTYMVWFSATAQGSAIGVVSTSVSVDGVVIDHTVRQVDIILVLLNTRTSVSHNAIVTVDGSEAIQILWRVSSGNVSMGQRTMGILRLS